MLTIRPQLKVRDKQQIDDVHRVVRLKDNKRSASRRWHYELPVSDMHLAPIRHVDVERPKGLGVIQRSNLLDGHNE